MSKYGHRSVNWLEAIVNKLGGEQQAERFLRDELSVFERSRSWCEEDGVIYFSVESDGTDGETWITRLKDKGFNIDGDAEAVLLSSDFKPTRGVLTQVAILKGFLFEDNRRTLSNVRIEASKRKLRKPNIESACLMRDKFEDKEITNMGMEYIVTMHEPVKVYPDKSNKYYHECRSLLSVHSQGLGRWLNTTPNRPTHPQSSYFGFAFAVPTHLTV